MDNTGATQGRTAQPAPHQQGSLIRVEQVKKLPHLTDQQKVQHEAVIKKLWDTINSRPVGSEEYTAAYQKLSAISNTLMQAMKSFQQRRQQIAQAATQGAARQSQGNASTVSFHQLSPEIQRRVNEARFYYPPAMIEGTKAAEDWLREAKARYGHALQRSEIAKQKKAEFQRSAAQREQAGNPLNQQEQEVYNNKVGQCNKAIQESESFMTKFREQQASFRAQTQARFSNQGPAGVVEGSDSTAVPGASATGGPGPTAHSISSAVSAARSQASAAQASPPPAQAQLATSTTPTQSIAAGMNPSPYHPQGPQIDGLNGLHRPLPHPQQHPTHPQSTTHAHPPNYLNPTKKDDRHPISKHIQAQPPVPVERPPSRPTLTGGPNVGMSGQMAMPALSAYPGYVLEASENGRVLSKKKLNELVREVCGPGQDEQLTPDVEEVSFFSSLPVQ